MPTPLALALDLGGTKVESALIDSEGRLVDGSRHRRPTGATSSNDELECRVRDAIAETLQALQDDSVVTGVGIGSAGPIDLHSGRVSPLNLPAWRDYPLIALVSDSLPKVPVTLRMDGLCIALAEHWVGSARDTDNLLGIVVSTGIGGGLILGGRSIAGPTGNAGHVGHLEIAGFDDECGCGGHGCLEAVASGPRSVGWARERGWAGSTGEDLAASYSSGDDVAIAAVRRSALVVGHAIGSVAALVDLDVVAIGGGFSRVTTDYIDLVREGVGQHSGFDFIQRVQVRQSALSDEGPLIGAGALVHRAAILA